MKFSRDASPTSSTFGYLVVSVSCLRKVFVYLNLSLKLMRAYLLAMHQTHVDEQVDQGQVQANVNVGEFSPNDVKDQDLQDV